MGKVMGLTAAGTVAMAAAMAVVGCSGPDGASDLGAGFEGIRWGQQARTVDWLVSEGPADLPEGLAVGYMPRERTVKLAGRPADQAEFCFQNAEGFVAVILHFKGKAGFLAAKEYLWKIYGPGANPSALNPPTEFYSWGEIRSGERAVSVFLCYDPSKDLWTFTASTVKGLVYFAF